MRGADTALDLAELAGGGVVEVWAGPGQPPPAPSALPAGAWESAQPLSGRCGHVRPRGMRPGSRPLSSGRVRPSEDTVIYCKFYSREAWSMIQTANQMPSARWGKAHAATRPRVLVGPSAVGCGGRANGDGDRGAERR